VPHLISKCPQGGFDNLALMVNYINKQWKACHVIIGIFSGGRLEGSKRNLSFKAPCDIISNTFKVEIPFLVAFLS
jgi:hypothetical protein